MRVIVLFCGLMGAVSLAQFPDFSQAYVDRLQARVAELNDQAAAFDTAAAAAGLSREGALRQLSGSPALEDKQAAVRTVFDERERLSADLARLQGANPFQRLAMPRAFADETLRAETYAAYRPTVPKTADGLILAGVGYVLASTIAGTIFAILRRTWPRRKDPRAAG